MKAHAFGHLSFLTPFVRLLVVFIVGLAAGTVICGNGSPATAAHAQPARLAGVGGVMAFNAQLDKDNYGIIMVDVDAGTLWVYKLTQPGDQLKLTAARSWMYDRYLEEYNCASPTPTDVSQLVRTQGQQGPSADVPGK